MKYQIQFPGKNKKNITILSPAELTKSVLSVKGDELLYFTSTN